MKKLHKFSEYSDHKLYEAILNKTIKFNTKTSSNRAYTMQKQGDKYVKLKLGKGVDLDILDLVDNKGYLYWLVKVKVDGKIVEGYVADKFVNTTPDMSFFKKEFLYKKKKERDFQNSEEQYNIEMKRRHIQKGKDMLTNIKARFAKDQEKIQAKKAKQQEREERKEDRQIELEKRSKEKFFKKN